MEGLMKLERVQRALSALGTQQILTGHHDSDRFLANLVLFLLEPCGALDLDQKCALISENLRKISSVTFEDAKCFEIEEENQQHRVSGISLRKSNLVKSFGERNIEDSPKISLQAMQRANSTLEDFCRSYFMFHEMDANNPQSIFKYLPMLSFTESYIYQLDIMNEQHLHSSSEVSGQTSKHLTHDYSLPNFNPLIHLLECHGLMTQRIRSELRTGSEYWSLERKLCHALKSKMEICIEDVMRAISLKSFDYRVLNLLMYQLTGQQVNDLHMDFLSISEFLVEISDDLYDYEDDVTDNSFNVLRMFIAVYGASLAPSMLAKYITEAEEKYNNLSRSLDPELSLKYSRRCEEATKEGGKTSGHSFGTWHIPPVIVDEEAYRTAVTKQSNSNREL